jgi:hypothetical protein
MADAKRRRVKLIECQYRMPAKVKVIASGPMKGSLFDERAVGAVSSVASTRSTII